MYSFKKSLKFIIILIGCIIGTISCDNKTKDTYTYECKINSENHNVETLYVYEVHTVGGICDTVKVHDEIILWRSSGCSYIDIKELKVEYLYVDKVRRLLNEVIIK